MDGRLDTMVREEARESLNRVICLRPLLPHVSGQWLVIWDGSPLHKGHIRTDLAAGGATQMPGEQLPPDAPELNPGAGVWHPWKNVARRHRCCRTLVPLRSELGLAMKRLRRNPRWMTACFAEAGLPLEN
jgi:hypothetical protein